MIKIKESTLEKTCGACPSQWEGYTTEGDSVYIRVRNGYFYLKVKDEAILEGYPNGIDGVMSTSEMIDYVERNSNILFV
jgi:hypothetical protein